MIYLCCDEHRRDAVRHQRAINGIDFLEVVDDPSLPLNQRPLMVHFIHPLQTDALDKNNVRIKGGERIRDVAIVDVTVEHKVARVRVDKSGDLSTYVLYVEPNAQRLRLDPLLSSVDFTFRATDPDKVDCETEAICLPEPQQALEIDYLAKDFNSFRQLMLDRLTVLMPQWKERSVADIGVMLVEILAYVGDHLSYQQDVIATESYLTTARRRISMRRHARLLDYFINEGCNARVWVQVKVNEDMVRPPDADDSVPAPLPKGTPLLTKVVGLEDVLLPQDSLAYQQALGTQPELFETMYAVNGLFKAHNELYFYTWGARECCLPKGATHATLQGSLPNLRSGDVLIFQEMLGPHTGLAEDANPAHRHAVRLTKVCGKKDPLGAWFTQSSKPGTGTVSAPGTIIEEVTIREKDRVVEEVVTTTKEGSTRIEATVDDTVVDKTREREEKETIKDGHVVEEKVKEKDTVVEEDEGAVTATLPENVGIEEEDDEDTQKLPVIRSDTQQEGSRRKGRGARRKRKDTEDEKVLDDEHTLDVNQEQTVEVERVEYGSEGVEVERIVDETRVVEEERKYVQEEPEPDYSVDITEIEWDPEDALPFPLCISAMTDYQHDHRYLEKVSVALGNIVLADHGQKVNEKDFAVVPQGRIRLAASSGKPCEERPIVLGPSRFYPSLKYTPLTHAAPLTYEVPYSESNRLPSAHATMQFLASDAVPGIILQSVFKSSDSSTKNNQRTDVSAVNQGATNQPPTSGNTQETSTDAGTPDQGAINRSPTDWQPKRDLLNSDPVDPHFVIEIEAYGTTYLRFGDNQHGLRPLAGTTFTATYRIGNGMRGNIGAEALKHIVTSDSRIAEIGNPLSAVGGTEPESIEDVRQKAPTAFNMQERGVRPADYKEIAERNLEVHRANAVLRWTGSWYTVFLAIDRADGREVDEDFKQKLRQQMERFRMAGGDLEIVGAVYVSLEIDMTVTVKPNYFRNNVKAALLEVFSSRQWPDGQRGIFYPDNYTFGQPVYLSTLIAAASAVPGVDSVDITRFQRQGIPGTGLSDGVLTMDWLEIARMDNDPNYPGHGILYLQVEGGK